MTPSENFLLGIDRTDTCWLWTGSTNGRYGKLRDSGSDVYAHRWAYEHYVGPIPDGLEIDHLCEVKLCVNPAHLEPVTRSENIWRWAQRNLSPTCRNGHQYTADNTRMGRSQNGRMSRRCLVCLRANQRNADARYRARRTSVRKTKAND